MSSTPSAEDGNRSETLWFLEHRAMNKIQKLSNPEGIYRAAKRLSVSQETEKNQLMI
jgi:hypothetical protein